MGLFDKLKGMVNAVTGGVAKVTIQIDKSMVYPGDEVAVVIAVASTGAEVKSKGIYVDIYGEEKVTLKKDGNEISDSKITIKQEFLIAPALTLGAGESKTFEGKFSFPRQCLPTYEGSFTQHQYWIRGRMEAFGNDPDSGFQKIMVGSKL